MDGIRKLLSAYPPPNIFNSDETDLQWKLVPDRSLATRVSLDWKEEARISLLFCCDSNDSERLPVWFIGNVKKTRAFAAVGIKWFNFIGAEQLKEACLRRYHGARIPFVGRVWCCFVWATIHFSSREFIFVSGVVIKGRMTGSVLMKSSYGLTKGWWTEK